MELADVRRVMAAKTPVVHNGITYRYITKCILYLHKRQWKYSVEMMDANGRSVVVADMDHVEAVEKGGTNVP